ncbi:hypothetical protein [Spirillospora sp. NBC_01491]|uniref:hypothetical protein n=1 Tax=Spirillospora sp. NBC_01491 TaxID=2976007 RepID=UPI002E374A85|nr:hypothetical protein [Spirillospora sp. NBC_01491]
MTPVDELRAAATRLRETAAKATPGPWKTKGFGEFGWLVVDANPAGRFSVETEDNEHGRADAVWIALASPVLAEPLADWLEQCANDLAGAERTAAKWPGDFSDPLDICDEPDSVRRALTLARAVNRGAK